MNYILRSFASSNIYNKIKQKQYPLEISGIVDVAKASVASLMKEDNNNKICIITYNEIQAQKIVKDLNYFEENAVMFFPKKEISIYDYDAESSNSTNDRIKVLNSIYQNKASIIVTTIEAVMQSMISKEAFFENVIDLKRGDELELNKFKEKLVSLGYKRDELVDGRMQFSIRGDIVDISLDENLGIRIELWGDEIDSIRKFKLSSQRTIEMCDNITIFPADEKVLEVNVETVCERIRKSYNKENNENILEDIRKDIEQIENGNYKVKTDKYFNEFYECSNFLQYLEGFTIILDEKEKIEQREKAIKEDNNNLIKELMEREKFVPDAILNLQNFDDKIDYQIQLTQSDKSVNNMRLREVTINNGDINELKQECEYAKKEKRKTIVLAGSKENQDKIVKAIPEAIKADKSDDVMLKDGEIIVTEGALSTGFEDKRTNLLVISSEEFFSSKKYKKRANNTFTSSEKIVFADLKVNDLVVHRNYGIGIFTGVKTIEIDGIRKDYITIKYRGGDILYVPTDDLDNVRKYIGGETNIQLNKLGTKEWKETKERVKGNLRAVAKELIELYAKREHSKGYAFSKDTPWQKEFEADFPYQETDDQLRCIEEVKKDMESSKPMDRLLCGDVGYGKTEVAIRAAFKAAMDSKQVCYLAPTTILANQQYQEFKERMKNFPVRIDLLNRFRTRKQQMETIQKLKLGEIDIVIGTHRVLSKDVEFKDLGLLIIDEEQRFGVKAKEKIKKYKESIDVLTMTATPIPRTLQLSIVGIRDMSVIYEPPQNRRPIQTYVLEYDLEVIKEAITKELERGGQVFYIFNNVENIEKKANEIEGLVPEAKVTFAHGQMTGSQIEEIMEHFIEKESNVLVCTTILESGIDIPNANTIIVENADRFGLAQLYQIRGRVGRSNKQAYAYITYRKDKMINEDASQRLKAIKEFTEFGSGFKIATRDLQIRGAGSLFGEIQSGHIEQVGYDMYSKLLDEVIKETEGNSDNKEESQEEEITIDVNLSAYIPDSYIEDSSQKIEIYQDIAASRNEDDVQNVIDEIIDRYGDMPAEVSNLIEIARIKNLARKKKISKIKQTQIGIVFTFTQNAMLSHEKIKELIEKYKNGIQFSASAKPYITLKVKKTNATQEIKEFLKTI